MSVSIDLEGKIALVAGGSSGIGLGIARRLRTAGATVHVTGTRAAASDYIEDGDEDGLDGLAYRPLEIADDEAVRAFADGFGTLDILISSVGTVAYGGREYDIDTFRRILDVNLNGVMHLCTSFRDRLRSAASAAGASSSIVLVGSTSSFIATPGQPAYGASKGAMVTLVRSLAQAWARDGIRVNGVAPGFVATKLTKRSREDAAVYAQTLERIPLGRWGEPEEMGDVALFLASPMASYVTGQMLLADGGMTLM